MSALTPPPHLNPPPPPAAVTLHIEHLVVQGLPLGSVDGRRLRDAIESHLSELLATQFAPEWSHSFALDSLRAAQTHPLAVRKPASLGHEVAATVVQTLSGLAATASHSSPP